MCAGCLNGGGQIKAEGGQGNIQKHIARLDEVYHNRDEITLQWPQDDPEVAELYASVLHSQPFSPHCRALLHTQYHHREKTVQAAVLDW